MLASPPDFSAFFSLAAARLASFALPPEQCTYRMSKLYQQYVTADQALLGIALQVAAKFAPGPWGSGQRTNELPLSGVC